MDPWDREAGRWYLHDETNSEKNIPDSAIYFWDAHFSTNFTEASEGKDHEQQALQTY